MFKRKALAVALTAAVAGFGAGTAGATALGFEGAPDGSFASSFTESGYTMSVIGGMFSDLQDGTLGARELEELCCNSSPDYLIIKRTLGGNFQFESIDAQREYGGVPVVRVEGFLGGILQATDFFSVPGSAYSTFLASNLQLVTIDELRIQAQRDFGPGSSFDNVVLREIDGQAPIPGTLALLGLGLAGLGVLRRKAA